MKKLAFFFLLMSHLAFAQGSFEVLHYSINVSKIDFSKLEIQANTTITIASIGNLAEVNLDLLQLKVDSVKLNANTKMEFSQTNTNVLVSLMPIQTDTFKLQIFYQGKPFTDPSNFGGGFYLGTDYAYNIGVGFSADPHNLGRAWFPCIDNFTSRATCDFKITTPLGFAAICNGELKQVLKTTTTNTFSYTLSQKIPPYLVAMDVGKYITIKDNFNGMFGPVPVEINVLKKDSIKAIGSFENLGKIFENFEKRFGPYQWPVVRFTAVPIVGGAMEHATNIAINAQFVDGNKTYESTFAHELAHHWFGDLVTCPNAEEMWLNEGFAVFSEYLYMEDLYGKQAGINYIRNKHFNVLKNAHVRDGGYFPVDNVPHSLTYGTTVYEKGGLVANSLRNYIGDSLYMEFLKFNFTKNAFRDQSTQELKNEINAYTKTNTDNFFDDWVSSPGFPDFRIDSFSVTPIANKFLVRVNVAQKNLMANRVYKNNKSEFAFVKQNGSMFKAMLNHSDLYSSDSILLDFIPQAVLLDVDDKMSADAVTDHFEWIKGTGKKSFNNAYFQLETINNPDSALIQIAHHWVGADSSMPLEYNLSNGHYWKVDGLWPNNFSAKATFSYRSEFDQDLINGNENAVVLLFRKNSGDKWKVKKDFTLTTGASSKDNSGSVMDINLQKGEYTIGVSKTPVGIKINEKSNSALMIVSPNPNNGIGKINFEKGVAQKIFIANMLGAVIWEKNVSSTDSELIFDISSFPKGNYIISLQGMKGILSTQKISLN